MFERPNSILQQQQEIQKGATPYLRGDADPTYLRKSGDSAIAATMLGLTACGWLSVLYYHRKMWTGQKN